MISTRHRRGCRPTCTVRSAVGLPASAREAERTAAALGLEGVDRLGLHEVLLAAALLAVGDEVVDEPTGVGVEVAVVGGEEAVQAEDAVATVGVVEAEPGVVGLLADLHRVAPRAPAPGRAGWGTGSHHWKSVGVAGIVDVVVGVVGSSSSSPPPPQAIAASATTRRPSGSRRRGREAADDMADIVPDPGGPAPPSCNNTTDLLHCGDLPG